MPAGFVGGTLPRRSAAMSLIVAAIAAGLFLAAGLQGATFGGSAASSESNSGDVVLSGSGFEW